jgi:hypothetical protein
MIQTRGNARSEKTEENEKFNDEFQKRDQLEE